MYYVYGVCMCMCFVGVCTYVCVYVCMVSHTSGCIHSLDWTTGLTHFLVFMWLI